MSHHGREGEPQYSDADYEQLAAKFRSAIALIQRVADGLGVDGSPAHGGSFATITSAEACDRWLEANGYECEASRRRQRERRADQLDAEIARLRAEREKL